MARRKSASDLERAAARRAAPAPAAPAVPNEALAMLLRRGLRPRPSAPDLPFPPDVEREVADRVAERLSHYAFRLFLRGAILAAGPFLPEAATRYVPAAIARRMARELATLGLAEPLLAGRFRLRWPARNFGGTLEWWVGRELARRLGFAVATGVRSGTRSVGGDLDVVAAAEGKLVYLELKSSPPKHLTRGEVRAFLRRAGALRPAASVLVIDTALRLSDKVLPMLDAELSRDGVAPPRRRLVRDSWRLDARLYVVSARGSLIDNIEAAIADALLGA
jgi:hypothetical protein